MVSKAIDHVYGKHHNAGYTSVGVDGVEYWPVVDVRPAGPDDGVGW